MTARTLSCGSTSCGRLLWPKDAIGRHASAPVITHNMTFVPILHPDITLFFITKSERLPDQRCSDPVPRVFTPGNDIGSARALNEMEETKVEEQSRAGEYC
jgi:hypothetical protein